jgi:uncharacterized membrane protein
MKKFLRLSLVTAVMLTFTGAVLAQVISFDAGPNGNTYPSGINEEGRIVGSFYDENGMSFGFLQKKDGSFVLFNAGSIWTIFNAINSKGQILGTYVVSDVDPGETAGFLLQPDGTIIGLRIGQQDAHPVDINGAGVIVGDYQDTNWKTHGFVRKSDGTFVSIDVIGSISTTPRAVNQVGQIVGTYWDGKQNHGFLRQPNGTITSFDPSGSIGTAPFAINRAGQIVGCYADVGNVSHGFLRQPDGKITSFDAGPNSTCAEGINSFGYIVGGYADANRVTHGFLRKPDGTVTSFSVGTFRTAWLHINNAGYIVGQYTDEKGVAHGFLRRK